MVLAFLGQVLSPTVKERLQAPRNLTVVSEDFKLFLRWQPADNYPPEVFYTVKWRNMYAGWNTTHCVNISATSCDITCVNQRPNNRFRVQVEALERTGRSSAGVQYTKYIDYNLDVELAPPVLQVREAEKVLVVNTTFAIPSCVKDLFQDLCYELEFWEQGTKPMKSSDLTENVFRINTTLFSSGHYCVQAQAYHPMIRKRSNFSEPVCGLLHKGGITQQGGKKHP